MKFNFIYCEIKMSLHINGNVTTTGDLTTTGFVAETAAIHTSDFKVNNKNILAELDALNALFRNGPGTLTMDKLIFGPGYGWIIDCDGWNNIQFKNNLTGCRVMFQVNNR
jgi:hypothetical protein